MRSARHNIEHVYTLHGCLCYYTIVVMSTQVVTYQKTMKTWMMPGPPLEEFLHNNLEELDCDITFFHFVGKAYADVFAAFFL